MRPIALNDPSRLPLTRMRRACLPALLLLLPACAISPHQAGASQGAMSAMPAPRAPAIAQLPVAQETAAWWFANGAAAAASSGAIAGRGRNVIIFLGDGMSLPTVAAARILDGQRKGGTGEGNRLAWEDFPATALAKTYNTDSQTPDSAGTFTAIATGIKTRRGLINIGPAAVRDDCSAALANPLLSILELAKGAGLATGVVTTTRITHATPAATYAHSAERNWENDTQLPPEAVARGCIDIARQLVELPASRSPDVVFGGGRMHFMTVQQRDPEEDDKVGLRLDGRDLVADWQARHPSGAYVTNRVQLQAADGKAPILGLFNYDHLHYDADRKEDPGEPSLAELTTAAITRLAATQRGFVLLVEGGRIDHAHHDGNAYRALTDTIAMSQAVAAALQATSSSDTTILVTADHAHTMTFAGYPVRGNPILGKVIGSTGEDAGLALARDATGLPYTTLGYANGPGHTAASGSQPAGPKRFEHAGSGYVAGSGRPDLTDVDTTAPDYLQESVLPLSSETHGGDDVGVWAYGPAAAAVRGTIEQNVIFHLLVQGTPALRKRLCDQGLCDAAGVPVRLPVVAEVQAAP